MTSSRSVVFAEPVRTAIGTFGGNLKEIPAPDLGAAVIKAALERAGLKPEEVGTVAMGNASKPASR
jgi:acetyl-CoA C-acetyltransferase